MGPDDPQDIRRFVRKGRQHALAQRGMLGNLPEFLGCKGAGLVEHILTRSDLPDVVQLTAEPNPVETRSVEAEPRRRGHSVLADPYRVAPGICVLGFQCSGKHLDTLQKELLDSLGLLLNLALEILLVEPVLKDQRALFEGADHSGLELAK